MKLVKIAACAALATMLIGCGKNGNDSTGASSGSGKDASPKVAADAVAVAVLQNPQKTKLASALEKAGFDLPSLINKKAPNDVKEMWPALGLDKSEWRWMALSAGSLKGDESDKVSNLSFALSFDHDMDKLVVALKGLASEDGFEFTQVTIADATAWKIHNRTKAGPVPCIASLDGKLLLMAMSSSALERQILLYRDGKGSSKDFSDFKLKSDDILKIVVAKTGESLRDAMGSSFRKMTRELRSEIPDADKMLSEIGKLELSLAAGSDDACCLHLAAEMGSESDADNARTLLKTGAMLVAAQLKKQSKTENAVKGFHDALSDAFQKVEIGGKTKTVEAKLNFLFKSILILADSVSGAMTAANSSAMAMRGRNLFVGITRANIERETAGLVPVWPQTSCDSSGSDDDIADKAFENATDYFNELFDMANYGKRTWKPYVNLDVGHVLKQGSNWRSGKFVPSQIAWSVAANASDEMPDCIPVLVSSNFDPFQLLAAWDGRTDGNKLLRTTDGNPLVIIRKSGASEVIKPKYCTYNNIYQRQAFDNSGSGLKPGLVYLTPDGVAYPRGR